MCNFSINNIPFGCNENARRQNYVVRRTDAIGTAEFTQIGGGMLIVPKVEYSRTSLI